MPARQDAAPEKASPAVVGLHPYRNSPSSTTTANPLSNWMPKRSASAPEANLPPPSTRIAYPLCWPMAAFKRLARYRAMPGAMGPGSSDTAVTVLFRGPCRSWKYRLTPTSADITTGRLVRSHSRSLSNVVSSVSGASATRLSPRPKVWVGLKNMTWSCLPPIAASCVSDHPSATAAGKAPACSVANSSTTLAPSALLTKATRPVSFLLNATSSASDCNGRHGCAPALTTSPTDSMS
mmetsp:Transcript_41756/g.100205  ORF Transcript_41756/g.100205 Transcript_41756/m.100205 type:complete len:237 (-) Transcript_41756:325-1035(-)